MNKARKKLDSLDVGRQEGLRGNFPFLAASWGSVHSTSATVSLARACGRDRVRDEPMCVTTSLPLATRAKTTRQV